MTVFRDLTTADGAPPRTILPTGEWQAELDAAERAARALLEELRATEAATPPALPAGLEADKPLQAARRGAATAAKQLGEVEGQIADRRAALAALGDAPASVERAGAWASERRALGDEIAALEGLALGPRHAAQEAARAAEEAQATAVARLAAAHTPDAAAIRAAWAAARAEIDADYGARLAAAEREAAAVAQAAGRLS